MDGAAVKCVCDNGWLCCQECVTMDGAAVKDVWQWMALLSRVCGNGWLCCQGCVTMDGSAVIGM